MKILIKGGRVVDPKNDFDKVADVLVDNGVISETLMPTVTLPL